MEVIIIKHYLILKYLQFKPKLIKSYYKKFKTTKNLYNFILKTSKQHLLNYIKYQYPHLNKHSINTQIIKLYIYHKNYIISKLNSITNIKKKK